MKKSTIFLILLLLVITSTHFLQAQTVQGDLFKLTQRSALIDDWHIQYTNVNQLEFSLNGTQSILRLDNQSTTITNSLIVNQKIGIGTALPSESLTISNGFGSANGFIVYGSSSTQSNWNTPWYGISKGDESQIDFVPNVNNSNPVVLSGFYGVAFKTNKGTMAMDDDGVVSIGLDAARMQKLAKNTPSWHEFKLYVGNGIRTEKVKVDNRSAWPDYVFNSSYDLMPLSEVETFINENSHLPQVPSEAEINENGIDLAQMDATLLKKIEELTLYTIEQEKQIELLTKELKSLLNKINENEK